MANDDYDVILCKVLVYLYAVMKRKTVFISEEFEKTVKRDANEEYFKDVLRLAQEEGFIAGLNFTRAWGGTYILLSAYSDMEITAAGIRYLNENSGMRKVLNTLKQGVDVIASLASIVGLYS